MGNLYNIFCYAVWHTDLAGRKDFQQHGLTKNSKVKLGVNFPCVSYWALQITMHVQSGLTVMWTACGHLGSTQGWINLPRHQRVNKFRILVFMTCAAEWKDTSDCCSCAVGTLKTIACSKCKWKDCWLELWQDCTDFALEKRKRITGVTGTFVNIYLGFPVFDLILDT